MSTLTVAVLNDLVNRLATTHALFLSAHTANPGATGTDEVSGGSYIRKAATWDTAANGERVLTAPVELDIPGSNTVTHVGLWDAESGGNFIGFEAVTVDPFTADGILRFTVGTKLKVDNPA